MTPALQAELWRRLEHAVALLDNEFWGEVVLRVQAGNLRVIDVQQRLKKPAAATTEATSS